MAIWPKPAFAVSVPLKTLNELCVEAPFGMATRSVLPFSVLDWKIRRFAIVALEKSPLKRCVKPVKVKPAATFTWPVKVIVPPKVERRTPGDEVVDPDDVVEDREDVRQAVGDDEPIGLPLDQPYFSRRPARGVEVDGNELATFPRLVV
jgi:hypothetical protein